MQKKYFKSLLGAALTATLVLGGCGSGGDGSTGVGPGGGGVAVTGGGGGTTTGGTTGAGLTGGTITTAGGGGTTTTTGGGTATATTGAPTTTTTTTGSPTTPAFLNAVMADFLRAGLNNPTAFASAPASGTTRNFVLQGFNSGANFGSLSVLDVTGTFDPANGFPIRQVTARAPDSNAVASLSNPFDVVSDGSSLYISVGYGLFGNGAIIKVSSITDVGGNITGIFQNLTLGATNPNSPTYLTIANGFVYWTEYSSSAGGGSVRRVSTSGTGTVETVINNLNFPAGIDHDGSRLAICEVSGGGTSQGRMILAPLPSAAAITTPLNGATADVTEVTLGGQAAILRPFDVVYDGFNGFFFTEGAALAPGATGGPGGSAGAVGAVRFIPTGSTQATIISSGLNQPAGIDAVDSNGDGVSAVLFSEGLGNNGRILRRLVDTDAVTNVAPNVVEAGLFSPLTVSILNENQPAFAATINYTGGANGSIRVYAP